MVVTIFDVIGCFICIGKHLAFADRIVLALVLSVLKLPLSAWQYGIRPTVILPFGGCTLSELGQAPPLPLGQASGVHSHTEPTFTYGDIYLAMRLNLWDLAARTAEMTASHQHSCIIPHLYMFCFGRGLPCRESWCWHARAWETLVYQWAAWDMWAYWCCCRFVMQASTAIQVRAGLCAFRTCLRTVLRV